MQKQEAYYTSLVLGFIDNKLSPNQVQELLDFIQSQPAWYDRLLENEEIKRKLSEQADNSIIDISEAVSQRMKDRLMTALQDDGAGVAGSSLFRVLTSHWRWVAAAAILIAITTAIFLSVDQQPKGTEPVVVAKSTLNDVSPGGNKATLRLSNGQVINLDSAANGSLATQGNAKIVKLADGQIAYTMEGKAATEVMYNTMSTPPGGQFKLKLPDGTDVWLNAASSITYPAAFTDKDRTVSITGEAYFEVKPLTSQQVGTGSKRGEEKIPFVVKIVTSKGERGEVRVLGTHFNINAYDDEEAIKTTLLEGSVKVVNGQWSMVNKQPPPYKYQEALLKPGEQVSISQTSQLSQPIPVQTDLVMAWKNGLFNFNKVSLQDVMKQIARWYDVDIVYQGEIKPKKFGGEIQRDLNLSEVLDGLKETGIHFRIEGKKLIVLP
jgi:transmembrane sensor